MRKKIKVSIPRLVKEILEQDMEYFNYTREKLCNLIIQELGYEKTIPLHEKMEDEDKVVINFNLYEKNTIYFNDMLKESKEETEREFLRRIFSTYVNFHPSIREKVIRKELFNELEKARKRNKMIKVSHKTEILTIKALGLERDNETGYNYIRAIKDNQEYLYKVKDIESLKIKY